jgi:hypothetical protein
MIVKFPTLAMRPNVLQKKGDYIDGHTHTFDHVSMVVRGAVVVEVTRPDGWVGRRYINAPNPEDAWHSIDRCCFNVPADWKHKITALTDLAEFWCAYVPRDEKGEIKERFDPADDYEWVCG